MVAKSRLRPFRPVSQMVLFLTLGVGFPLAARTRPFDLSPVCEGQAEGAGSQPSVDEVLSQAERALRENHLDEALRNCQQAIERNPESAKAYYLLGIVQDRRGKQGEAQRALIEALKLDPSDLESHLALGRIYLQSRMLSDAAREFQAAINLGDSVGRGVYGLGLALVGEQKYREALPLLAAAVGAEPKDPEKLFTLIAVELQLNEVDKARGDLNRIKRLSLQDPYISFRLGKLLLDHKMSKEAEAGFEHAADLLTRGNGAASPDLRLSDIYLQIAQLRFNRFDYPAAILYLEKIEPGSVEPDLRAAGLDLLGGALLALGNAQEARAKYSQAVQLDSSDPAYVSHLAWAQLLTGDLDGAAASAELAQNKWPHNADVIQIAAIVKRESLPERKVVSLSHNWHIKGEGMVCCPCRTPCPCRSNAPPTYGHCESGGAIHIRQGYYGDTALDGLTFLVVHAAMGPQSLPAALYIDSTASVQQVVALEDIFQRFNPLRPLLFTNVKRLKTSFSESQDGKTYGVEIPGVLQFKIQRQLNSQGEPLLQTAALDYFSNTIEYAQNLIYRVQDPQAGLKWDFSGRQANFRRIDLDSQDYQNATMLIQFADGSGYFNEKQRELIRNLKLPTLPHYPKSSK